jgi:hypothetical protein
MNTIRKLAFIAMIPLACVAFVSSCSKGPETGGKQPAAARDSGAKKPKKGKKAATAAKVSAAAKADAASPEESRAFTARRDGQYADLNWQAGVPVDKIKLINILRSPTGVNKKKKIADLGPGATRFRDVLPDEKAQWYWVKLMLADGTARDIGPARVEPDKAGAANYNNREDAYKISITRTDELATLRWEFPDDKYKSVSAVRNTRPVEQAFKKANSTRILTTLEWNSHCTNALPDPNSEYWYWFQISLESGAVIYKGPIKAEYARPAAKSRGGR